MIGRGWGYKDHYLVEADFTYLDLKSGTNVKLLRV